MAELTRHPWTVFALSMLVLAFSAWFGAFVLSKRGARSDASREDFGVVLAATLRLQAQLWAAVKTPAAAQPDSPRALAVSGMNDVLNSQGYTQAAWWNRIPPAAWVLMALIAVCCNTMIGYGMRTLDSRGLLLLVLPLVVAVAFFLIADIDSPRSGVIHVSSQNLTSLLDTMR
jgi:hypothetical protein